MSDARLKLAEQEALRLRLALEATWQIESLSDIVLKSQDLDSEDSTVKGVTVRIKQLNSVIMSALSGDDGRTTGEMHWEVHGTWPDPAVLAEGANPAACMARLGAREAKAAAPQPS